VFFVGNNVVSLFADTWSDVNRSENLYGKGVHAFFDKNYSETINLLTQVEQLGSEDPRPYYFLALAHSRLKHNDKAAGYFKKAAQFEWEGQAVRDYNVSEALRRIQGKERLNVERYRVQAKLNWQNAEKRKRDILYTREKNNEKRILTNMATQHPVVVVPFGAQSIDPLKTGKKIEVLLSNDSDTQPKKESTKINTTTPPDDTEKSRPNDETNLKKDDKENKEDIKNENEIEEVEDNDPFK
jgi:tetratricopeptide (TPR) repeat protein